MYITDEMKQKILMKLKFTKNYGRIARDLATSIRTVEFLDITENKRFNYTVEGLGRPELAQYKIATIDLRQTVVWDKNEPVILQARDEYDKGLIEMVTGRDGFNLFLYAIPRKVRMARKPYFPIEKEAA